MVDDDAAVPDEGPSPERVARRTRDGELVRAVRAGDQQAFGCLFDDWYDKVHDVARRIVRRPDVADEVAQEVFLKAWNNLDSLEAPESFGGWVLRIARNGALNRREREARSSAVDDEAMAMIELHGGAGHAAPAGFAVEDRMGRISNPTVAVEDRELSDLVWQAAAALPVRDLEVLDLQLRHGLAPAEIGDLLGMNRNAANQLVHRLRGRLETSIRARVLWRSGEPVCQGLADRLAGASITAFDADAVKVIERHAKACDECGERQRTRLAPAALFSALPIMAVPLLSKQQAAAALIAQGVPLQGSACAAAATGAAEAAADAAGSAAEVSGATNASDAASAGDASAGGADGSGSSPGGSNPGAGEAPWETTGPEAIPGSSSPLPPAAASVAPPATDVGEVAAAGSSSTRRRVLVGAGVVVFLVVLGAGLRPVLAGRADAPELALTASGTVPVDDASTTTTGVAGPTSTIGREPTDPTVSNPGDATTLTTAPGSSTTRPTTAPPGPTATATTAPARVDAGLSLSAASAPQRYATTASPTLRWSVTGPGATGAVVTVSGPGVQGSGLSGSTPVCPGSAVRAFCSSPPGTYRYVLTVTDAAGRPLASRTATLTITATAPPTTTTTRAIVIP